MFLSARILLRHPAHALLRCCAGLAIACLAVADDRPGGWRLAAQSSPYLRLHADNPVQWYPWGEEALERARHEDKPLFISIGYFTCHWCHVMARESFRDPGIAARLNRDFVAVKIDREQRPDLDAAFMDFVRMTRGRGGWPLTVWATPRGQPFAGGTYFPPRARGDSPGLEELLVKISRLWREDAQAVRASAAQAVARLQERAAPVPPLKELDATTLERARRQIAAGYDELLGGFGPAPKFPQPARLLFLLQDTDPDSAAMALHTLEQMAAGAIHDQLGGGFHRYATDFEWRVPHFEKMLYDQALIARAFLHAFHRTGDPAYAALARRTLDFALAQLRAPEGGFYSALSAESPAPGAPDAEPQEGAYYTWTWRQLEQAIDDPQLRRWAAARYGIEQGGNVTGDPWGAAAQHNILYLAQDDAALAERFGVDAGTAARRSAEVERRLRAARARRPPVPVDDKIVSVWNGFMITTLAQAASLLEEPRYERAAARAADFVLLTLYEARDGTLFRDWRQGERGAAGFCDDYAAVAEGLLALYRASGEPRRLRQARRLLERQLELFLDPGNGGFFRNTAERALWVRDKEVVDGATLSVNGLAVHALLELAELTGDPAYRAHARATAAWAGARLADAPGAMPYLLMRWDELLQEPPAGARGTRSDAVAVPPAWRPLVCAARRMPQASLRRDQCDIHAVVGGGDAVPFPGRYPGIL